MGRDAQTRFRIRQKLKGHQGAMLARLEQLANEQDRVLYNGKWLAPDQVHAVHRRLKWKSRYMVLEIGVAVMLMFGAAYYAWMILLSLLGR